ncbi:hypothetical protein FPZ42_12825 [Mucilaginibacter achroorhodeus]|uniref:Uncharacterized protein n=1 Tax=Mucilaginibacter achroorhodeus TaxID=2599294 RepID=A0A563U1I4_9SPHI|nr:hypothetical protein [Mucilaginibacter achroorhodeus]TWR25476.1 hypothetical protein FPZ42_12825 [Mucilaginibacter achroorhodeus]
MESINKIKHCADLIGRKSKALLGYAIMTAAATMLVSDAHAQTFAEWFSQKKTQKKYLLQQIAALQVYSGYLKQGYKIANGGLGYITGSLKEEFNLHSTYYDKLKAVNPAVKNNPQVNDIITWQRDILRSISELDKVSYLSVNEKQYVGKVKGTLLSDCDEQISALQVLLTNGKLEMSDDERISRLNTIHLTMQSNYRFAADFSGRVKLYGVQKQQETKNLSYSKYIFGIR